MPSSPAKSKTSQSINDPDEISETWEVSFEWMRHQLGKVLEMFIVLQFALGSLIFFSGIFLLLWAVAPDTALRAGSTMLLATFIIGRALMGLVGHHTDNYGMLFSYGAVLVVTFVLRTVMSLVRLKIRTSPENQLYIPPLLYAAPGAFSISIELICSLLECSQALVAFYLCFLIAKTESLSKKLSRKDRGDIETAEAIVNRIIEDNRKKEQEEREKSKTISDNTEGNGNQDHHEDNENKASTQPPTSTTTSPPKPTFANKPKPPPLKGILHVPNNNNAPIASPDGYHHPPSVNNNGQSTHPPGYYNINYQQPPQSMMGVAQHPPPASSPGLFPKCHVKRPPSPPPPEVHEQNQAIVASQDQPNNNDESKHLIPHEVNNNNNNHSPSWQGHPAQHPARVPRHRLPSLPQGGPKRYHPPINYAHHNDYDLVEHGVYANDPGYHNGGPVYYDDLHSPPAPIIARPPTNSPMDIAQALAPTPTPDLIGSPMSRSPLLYTNPGHQHHRRVHRTMALSSNGGPGYSDYGSTYMGNRFTNQFGP